MSLEFTRGQTAILYSTFAVDNVPTDPTDPQVTIYNNGTVVLGPADMVKISNGYFHYEFTVPDDWDEDQYDALYTGTLNGINFKENDMFTVVASETLVSSSLPTGYYCTLGDVLVELYGISFEEPELSNYETYIINKIPTAHREVNRRTGRDYTRQTRVDFLDGTERHEIALPYFPVVAVSECIIFLYPSSQWYQFQSIFHENVRGTPGINLRTQDTNAAYTGADLIVNCAAGTLTIPDSILYTASMSFPYWDRTFVRGRRNVRVTATYGYPADAMAPNIVELCAKIAAVEAVQWKGNAVGGGAQSRNFDGGSASFGQIPWGGWIAQKNAEIENIISMLKGTGVS